MGHRNMKNDIRGDGDTIHYNCTGQFLVALIYHPYPLSFHEMIFIIPPLLLVSFNANVDVDCNVPVHNLSLYWLVCISINYVYIKE